MPTVEIGPFEVTIGEGDSQRTTKLLRIASLISAHVELPDDLSNRGLLIAHIAELLQAQEHRLALLLFSLKEGSVGFEEENGTLQKLTFSYPDPEETKGKPS